MPHFLTDEETYASESGIERPDTLPCLNEACLVEDSVGRQKHLPVDVGRLPALLARRQIYHAVVEPPTMPLEKTEDHIGSPFRWRAQSFGD